MKTKSMGTALALAAMVACGGVRAASARGEIKTLLCTGDYGMWAQDRATAIREGVE